MWLGVVLLVTVDDGVALSRLDGPHTGQGHPSARHPPRQRATARSVGGPVVIVNSAHHPPSLCACVCVCVCVCVGDRDRQGQGGEDQTLYTFVFFKKLKNKLILEYAVGGVWMGEG